MSAPEAALQAAVVAALGAAPGLAGLVGGHAVFDRQVEGAGLPYLLLGPMTTFDWSTATEAGTEHVFTLEAWSGEAGKREAQAIVAAVRAALHDRRLPLAAGTLVNLRLARVEVERIAGRRLYRATMRFRAVVEAGS